MNNPITNIMHPENITEINIIDLIPEDTNVEIPYRIDSGKYLNILNNFEPAYFNLKICF